MGGLPSSPTPTCPVGVQDKAFVPGTGLLEGTSVENKTAWGAQCSRPHEGPVELGSYFGSATSQRGGFGHSI